MWKHEEAARIHSLWLICIAMLGCGGSSTSTPIPSSSTQGVTGAAPFGTGCQETFQNNWQAGLNHVWSMCSKWNSRFDAVADLKWYYNLNGGKGWLQQPSGYGDNLDSVNFFFGDTHRGAFTGT